MTIRMQTFWAVSLLLSSSAAIAQQPTLLRIDSVWARNYATHDTATAVQLMSDDFFMTATNGAVKNKAAELADVRPTPNLTMKYFRVGRAE